MLSFDNSQASDAFHQAIAACPIEPVEIAREGKAVAILVHPDFYERAMNALEEIEDVRDFDIAISSDSTPISWDQIKCNLDFI